MFQPEGTLTQWLGLYSNHATQAGMDRETELSGLRLVRVQLDV